MRWSASPRIQAGALFVLILSVGAALCLFRWRGSLWRAAYPHLPRRAQAAPYYLRERLQSSVETPVAIPTADVLPQATPAAEDTPTPLGAMRGAAGQAAATSQPTSAATSEPLPEEARIDGLRHEYQTWNNCGPATISMALSRYGERDGQAAAAQFLKPDPDDKNVGPEELATYARLRGYEAPVYVNGTLEELKALIAAGIPVVVETWFVPEPGDEMGHYRVVTGYSSLENRLYTHDSYNGPDVTIGYDEFDRLWRVFNRTFMPVYPPERGEDVAPLLGTRDGAFSMYSAALARAYAELSEEEDAFGWFNAGSSLLELGDTAAAAEAFDRARVLGLPWRMLWYQHGPFAAYAALGRWSDVLALADANLRNAPNLEESRYYRGRALAAQGKTEQALAEWRTALQLNPGYGAAKEAIEAATATSDS